MSEPNYARAVAELLATLLADGQCRPGTLTCVTVEHDDGCDVWDGTGKPCNCEPTVALARPDQQP